METVISKPRHPVIKHILAIVVVGGLLSGLINLVHPRGIPWVQDWGNYVEASALEEGIEVIPLNIAYSLHQAGRHLFVDARPSEDYGKGHISDSITLPFEILDEQFEALDRILSTDTPVVVYCRNRECDDALMLAIELLAMGKTNLLYHVDGFELWEESGCPVEVN